MSITENKRKSKKQITPTARPSPRPDDERFIEGDQYIGNDPLPVPERDRYWDGGRN